ncbi:MAG: DUF481 domain-containing protein [Acidobacteriaceae bacterium]|nr:DUF481 domain-containing protein [Acidobacteriaceae bacterium]
MNLRALCVPLLLTTPLLSRENTDVIIMKNGDHLTGQVKGLDAGVLYVSLSYVSGTISFQWSQVARLESKQLFIVKTEDGSVYTGTLNTTESAKGRPVKIEIADQTGDKVVVESSRITKMGETSEKFWQRFSGEITFGTIYSKGNQSTQYNLGAEAAYLRERWSADASYNSTLSSSSGTSPSTRNQVNLSGTRLLRWNNYFYSGIASFRQSSEQGISLQSGLGGGVGRYFKNTNNAIISVLGGVGWQRTNYTPSTVIPSTQNVAAALIAAEVKLFKFSKTNLNVTAMLSPALSEPGRVFFNTNASYYVKLFSNLSWNISFYGNWDNEAPSHLSGSDYGTSSGLSWTFGLK